MILNILPNFPRRKTIFFNFFSGMLFSNNTVISDFNLLEYKLEKVLLCVGYLFFVDYNIKQ